MTNRNPTRQNDNEGTSRPQRGAQPTNRTCVAADTPTELRDVPIRFGVTVAKPIAPAEEGKLGKTTDGYSFGFEPLSNAYVIFAPENPQAICFEFEDERFCIPDYVVARTNAAGHVLLRFGSSVYDDPPAIDMSRGFRHGPVDWRAPAPVDDPFVVLLGGLQPGHGVFWTHDREVFDRVVSELDRDHAAAYARFHF